MMEIIEAKALEFDLFRIWNDANEEILSIKKDGRIFWRQREVVTDDDLRAAMQEIFKALVK